MVEGQLLQRDFELRCSGQRDLDLCRPGILHQQGMEIGEVLGDQKGRERKRRESFLPAPVSDQLGGGSELVVCARRGRGNHQARIADQAGDLWRDSAQTQEVRGVAKEVREGRRRSPRRAGKRTLLGLWPLGEQSLSL